MPRLMLKDEFWPKLEKILLQEAIYNKRNLRMTVEGVLYRMRVGCPWRDLALSVWMLEFHLQKIQCLVIE